MLQFDASVKTALIIAVAEAVGTTSGFVDISAYWQGLAPLSLRIYTEVHFIVTGFNDIFAANAAAFTIQVNSVNGQILKAMRREDHTIDINFRNTLYIEYLTSVTGIIVPDPRLRNSDDSAITLWLGIGLGGGGFVVLLFIFWCWCRRRRKGAAKKNDDNADAGDVELPGNGSAKSVESIPMKRKKGSDASPAGRDKFTTNPLAITNAYDNATGV